jgi:transposase-like protein
VDEARLKELVARGLTVRQIAAEVDRSYSTVRRWLMRYGLKTLHHGPGRTAVAGAEPNVRFCRKHGVLEFVRRGDGNFQCPKCRAERVSDRRRKVKAILVDEAGGRCQLCGYNRYQGALEFHHRDPRQKRFQLSLGGLTLAIDRLREEAQKCALLCANCHAEVEGGVATLL